MLCSRNRCPGGQVSIQGVTAIPADWARACLQWVGLGFDWNGGVYERHDVSDEQWTLSEPLLPVERTGRVGRPWGAFVIPMGTNRPASLDT